MRQKHIFDFKNKQFLNVPLVMAFKIGVSGNKGYFKNNGSMEFYELLFQQYMHCTLHTCKHMDITTHNTQTPTHTPLHTQTPTHTPWKGCTKGTKLALSLTIHRHPLYSKRDLTLHSGVRKGLRYFLASHITHTLLFTKTLRYPLYRCIWEKQGFLGQVTRLHGNCVIYSFFFKESISQWTDNGPLSTTASRTRGMFWSHWLTQIEFHEVFVLCVGSGGILLVSLLFILYM